VRHKHKSHTLKRQARVRAADAPVPALQMERSLHGQMFRSTSLFLSSSKEVINAFESTVAQLCQTKVWAFQKRC